MAKGSEKKSSSASQRAEASNGTIYQANGNITINEPEHKVPEKAKLLSTTQTVFAIGGSIVTIFIALCITIPEKMGCNSIGNINRDTIAIKNPWPNCEGWSIQGRIINSDKKYVNLDEAKVGVYAGPFSEDDKILNGVFKISGVTIPKDNFIQLYLTYRGKNIPFYKEPLNKWKQRIDTASCTITFLEDIIINNSFLNEHKTKTHSVVSSKTFQLVTQDLESLKARLLGLGYKWNINNPTYTISLEHTGNIEPINIVGLYRYNGGFMSVHINGRESYVFKEFPLVATDEGGNSLEFVTEKINSTIRFIVKLNENKIFNTIKGLLP